MSPVTHTAEADVKKASRMPMLSPASDASGRANNMVPISMTKPNPIIIILGEDNRVDLLFLIASPFLFKDNPSITNRDVKKKIRFLRFDVVNTFG